MKSHILRNTIVVIIYNLAIIATFLLACELYARHVYNYPGAAGFMTRDSIFHHIPPPYCKGRMASKDDFDIPFTLNNKGMRGPSDYVYDKNKDTFRVAILGDSFTFGMGVDSRQTASVILNKLLNSSGKNRYEALNFGVCSYSPLLEYIYLTHEAVKYNPDLVVLMLDESDVQDDYFYEPHIVRDREGNIAGCDPMVRNGRADIWEWCLKHSRLLYILDQKMFESLRKVQAIGFGNYIKNKLRKKRNKQEIILNKDIDNVRFDKFIMHREGKNKDVVMRHWSRTANYIKMIKEYLDRKGIRMVLVVYPYGHQVSENQWAKGRSYWAFERNKVYDPTEGFNIIADFARLNNIDFINLYSAFRLHKDEPLFFNTDGHWTVRAHEVAADAIFADDVFKRNLQ